MNADHYFSMIDTIERPYLRWLADGIKTAEGRVNTEKYRKMSIGDSVIFQCENRYIYGTIKFKHEYASFREMLISEGISNMLPFLCNNDIDTAVGVYEAFPGANRVHQFGCVAIGLNILSSSFC